MIVRTEEGGSAVLQTAGQPGILSALALFIWLGGIHINCLLLLLALAYLPSPASWTLLALLAALAVAPLGRDTAAGQAVARFISRHAPAHFPIKVLIEAPGSLDPSRAYVIAAEPHSVLPLGIVVLTAHSGFLPLTKLRCLASSAIFYTPLVRHVWSWLGLVPATRAHFEGLLAAGHTCILVPGGVRECLYLQDGHEVLYLRQRFGFVRAAVQTGAPVVPAFCFGQSAVYRWWKPSGAAYDRLSRAIGFTPLMFWGMFGTPIPYRTPMYFVVGAPIEVKRDPAPSREQVAAVHEQYLEAIRRLFDKYKGIAGHQNTQLHIY